MNKSIICFDIKGLEYSVPISKLSFRPSVYGVIVKAGKVLLSRQWDGYDFPGGAIELGETIEEALIREVKEETGLKAEVGQLLTAETSFFKLPDSEKYVHSLLLYYTCEVIGGAITAEFMASDERRYVSEAQWVRLETISQLKFYNSVDSVQIINKASK